MTIMAAELPAQSQQALNLSIQIRLSGRNSLKARILWKGWKMKMSHVICFFIGVWIGCFVGVCVMALMQAKRIDDTESEREKYEKPSEPS